VTEWSNMSTSGLLFRNQDNVTEWSNMSTSGLFFRNQDNATEWSNMSTSGLSVALSWFGNNNPLVDMLLHSVTLSWFRNNNPLVDMLLATCLPVDCCFSIRIMWPSGATCLPRDCCFSEIVIWKSNYKTSMLSCGRISSVRISFKYNLLSPWYSWKNAVLVLINNHSLTVLKKLHYIYFIWYRANKLFALNACLVEKQQIHFCNFNVTYCQ
jgi:hypothetical protein